MLITRQTPCSICRHTNSCIMIIGQGPRYLHPSHPNKRHISSLKSKPCLYDMHKDKVQTSRAAGHHTQHKSGRPSHQPASIPRFHHAAIAANNGHTYSSMIDLRPASLPEPDILQIPCAQVMKRRNKSAPSAVNQGTTAIVIPKK